MKKKLVLILATLMCFSICACGGAESANGDNKEPSQTTEQTTDNGFSPEIITETEEVIETVPVDVTVEEMQKYYDVEKYLGTPYLKDVKTNTVIHGYQDSIIIYVDYVYGEYENIEVGGLSLKFEIEYNEKLDGLCTYKAIMVDNNTPNDYSDDMLTYIFATPVE